MDKVMEVFSALVGKKKAKGSVETSDDPRTPAELTTAIQSNESTRASLQSVREEIATASELLKQLVGVGSMGDFYEPSLKEEVKAKYGEKFLTIIDIFNKARETAVPLLPTKVGLKLSTPIARNTAVLPIIVRDAAASLSTAVSEERNRLRDENAALAKLQKSKAKAEEKLVKAAKKGR